MPSGAITYLIHHIILPPKLPQGDDFNLEHESVMLETIIYGLSTFKRGIVDDGHRAIVDSALAMVTTLRDVRDYRSLTGAVNEMKLRDALTDLCREGENIRQGFRCVSYS